MKQNPVLLLPGTLCNRSVFSRQIEALEQHACSVQVVEFREERSIHEMANTVEARIPPGKSAAIAGFSMGGMVALAVAGRCPERIAKLALLNSNAHAEIPERHRARLQHLAAARRDGLAAMVERLYLPNYLQRDQPCSRKVIVDMAKNLGIDCFEAQLEALASRPDSSETLRNIHCPTLILGSANDPLCPPEVQIGMHKITPGSDLLLLGDCGHFSTLERPRAVNSALVNWYLEAGQRE